MKHHHRRFYSLLLSLVLLLSVFLVPGTVQAKAKQPFVLKKDTLWAKCEYWDGLPLKLMTDDYSAYDTATVVSVKSSNPKVIKVYWDKSEDSSLYGPYLEPRKVGKSTITLKYKYKGNTYTTKAALTVKKYPKPYKSVTFNGKKVNINNEKYYHPVVGYKKNTIKAKITPKKGWKVKSVTANYYNDATGASDWKVLKKSTITKGTAIKFPKKYDTVYIQVTLANKKGETIDYQFNTWRNDEAF